ncbi:MAG: protein kinase [Verrucomicrobia bacterium]|nr:protein kinase [Verrucomicrobiota bacterium]
MSSNTPTEKFPAAPEGEAGNICLICGLKLPPHTPPELCPRCLLGAGQRGTAMLPFGHAFAEKNRFGPYQLGRRLGSGGMGEVYEADDLETGRRVALKILSQRLDSPDARRRFLNEGRLAASINHPNSVYVFGTEEIAGVPVITMELMPGGTLEKIVRRQGPMAVTDAADATLQIIDGLAAAHAAGVLHRDIKPSNCFLDADDSVKIGDYGLSISTKGHERANASDGEAFMGTPAFASPEQLRGDDLTASSDIYSLGATLFYILTGKAPHEAVDSIRLLVKVLESPAPNLVELRPDIPQKLSNAVSRCLAKRPDDRFKSYQELRVAITEFSTRGKRAAELWERLLAGAVDIAIIGLPPLAASRLVSSYKFEGFAEFMIHACLVVFTVVAWIAWFTLIEWKWGRTPGKAWLGLEVRTKLPEKSPWIGLLKILGRSSLYVLLPVIFAFVIFPPLNVTEGETKPVTLNIFGRRLDGTYSSYYYASDIGLTTLVAWTAGMFLLFAGARRRNDWMALHDWLSDTRVVANAAPEMRSTVTTAEWNSQTADTPKLGPFHILEAMPSTDDWWSGYDPRLLRKVWLRKVSPGTPPVSAALRNLRRVSRLRWLAGIRSEQENWDAYEFPGGQALVKLAEHRIAWCELRPWMSDLAAELNAAESDDTRLSTPRIEQVWITGDGRAKLLDFPAPGINELKTPTGKSFWMELVERTLDRRPLPLPVRGFLEHLPKHEDPGMLARELEFLATVPVAVSRARRLGIIIAVAAGPFLLGLVLFGMKAKSLPVSLFWMLVALIGFVALPAMIAAALSGDGLIMRAAGVSVVDREGCPAGRARASRRSLIAWLPTLASPVLYAALDVWLGPDFAGIGTLAALALLAVISALLPDRTLHDRLAGTWLVPR